MGVFAELGGLRLECWQNCLTPVWDWFGVGVARRNNFSRPFPGEGIQFQISGNSYSAVVIATRGLMDDPGHGLTHLVRYTAGTSGTEWICLDASKSLLKNWHSHTEIAYKSWSCRGMWIKDVVIGVRGGMDTTGGMTWAASRKLFEYLEVSWSSLGFSTPVPRILELGSGAGWLGLTLARNVGEFSPPGSICLTEQIDGMEWLNDNLAEHKAAKLPLAAVHTAALDWEVFVSTDGDDVELPHAMACDEPIHLLLGADLVYCPDGVRLVPLVLKRFLCRHPGLIVIYGHKLHRYGNIDADFFTALQKVGLSVRAIAAEGQPLPKGICTDLKRLSDLHDMVKLRCRVVILQIVLAGSTQRLVAWSDVLSS